jgi:hypothetical protein
MTVNHQATLGRARDDILPEAPNRPVFDICSERQGAFGKVLADAPKGSHILYHVGEHCAGPHRKDARAAYESGFVILTLRRRARYQFEYIAVPVDKTPR